MHTILKPAMFALGALALAVPATAQEEEAAAEEAGSDGETQYVNTDPIIFASLDIRNSGSFTGVIDPATNELCYILNAGAVDQPTAAHIHVGGPGETGQPVVPLETPEDGASGACITIEADVAEALAENPGNYYVNVHSAAYPQGYARAQLRG